MTKSRILTLGASLSLVLACGDNASKRASSVNNNNPSSESDTTDDLAFLTPSALQLELAKQQPLQASAPSDSQKKLAAAVDSHYQRSSTERYYMHLDKPLYKPGETIWFRIWELGSSALTPSKSSHGTVVRLISPKGATVLEKRIRMGVENSVAANDFELPTTVQGGEYTLRITSDIELKLDSESPLPYSIGIEYSSKMPASSSESVIRLFTKLDKQNVPLGEGVRMSVSVKNISDKGQPMTLARVGIPGGLTFQTWQLKELMDKKIIDFYETHEREVVLYFRSMAPNAELEIPLQLIARVPGDYVGPASQAYLYYTNEFRQWSEPNRIHIGQ